MNASEQTRRAYDPALSDVLGDAGDPITVTDSTGRRWKIGFPTQRAKDRLQKFVFEEELRLIREQYDLGIITQPEFELRAERLAKQARGREFKQGGVLWVKHTAQAAGALLWVHALLAENHPDITREDVERLMQDRGPDIKAAMEVIQPPFFVWVLGMAAAVIDRAMSQGMPPEQMEKARRAKAEMAAALAGLTGGASG